LVRAAGSEVFWDCAEAGTVSKERTRNAKLQATNFKLQRNFKLQPSASGHASQPIWDLVLGPSVKFGVWSLKFGLSECFIFVFRG
jgi:hypothetical protein